MPCLRRTKKQASRLKQLNVRTRFESARYIMNLSASSTLVQLPRRDISFLVPFKNFSMKNQYTHQKTDPKYEVKVKLANNKQTIAFRTILKPVSGLRAWVKRRLVMSTAGCCHGVNGLGGFTGELRGVAII